MTQTTSGCGNPIQDMHNNLRAELHKDTKINHLLALAEARTGVPREQIVYGVGSLFSIYLVLGYFAQLVCNFVGMAYPTYASIKAIKSDDKNDDTQWLTYWVAFAIFSLIDFGAETIVGWFPVYWVAKCALFLYLYLPATMGAQKLYINYVSPLMDRYSAVLDAAAAQVSQEAQSTATKAVTKQAVAVLNQHEPFAMRPVDESLLASDTLTTEQTSEMQRTQQTVY